MKRALRPWWLALAGSLLLHGGLIGGLAWTVPESVVFVESPPIEARLLPLVPAAAPPAPAATPPRKPTRARPPRQPDRPAAAVAMGDVAEPAAVAAVPEAVAEAATPPVDAPPPEAVTETVPTAESGAPGPPLNLLPPRLDIRYQVRYGLATGEQTLVWINEGDAYTLTSVAAATGLAGVFYSGRFVQTSRGRITPRGLVPVEFWDQRGDRRSSARFDGASGTLTLNPAKGEPRHFAYQGDVQDVLSLIIQLALLAPPEGRQTHLVFNGKKLREYTLEVRGEDNLETALGVLRTLHLARVPEADGRFEAWLAADRHFLPVRVLRSDDKGNTMELLVQAMTP